MIDRNFGVNNFAEYTLSHAVRVTKKQKYESSPGASSLNLKTRPRAHDKTQDKQQEAAQAGEMTPTSLSILVECRTLC